MANPDANIIVVAGDGDSLAIGGNHFIHACRRNIGLKMIIINNYTYGLTGGQVSPSTPREQQHADHAVSQHRSYFRRL